MSQRIKHPNPDSLDFTRRICELSEQQTQQELDIALERSANARGIERSVLWWKGAGL